MDQEVIIGDNRTDRSDDHVGAEALPKLGVFTLTFT